MSCDIVRFAESSGGGRTLLFPDAWRFRDSVIDALRDNRPLDDMIREQIAGALLPASSREERTRQLGIPHHPGPMECEVFRCV